MKITYKKSGTRFDSIKVGEYFFACGDICMKIADSHQGNVFCIIDKTIYSFRDDSIVKPVEVELIVHAEGR